MKTFITYITVIAITAIGVLSYIDHGINNLIQAQAEVTPSFLMVQPSGKTQPYGQAQEDEETAAHIIQPTAYIAPPVTLHGYFLQHTANVQETELNTANQEL